MRAMLSKPYAKVLKEAFPQATFVGFSGTPIAETYQTFGDEIDRYTMDQAVADGLTVPIKYHPRIAKVLLDQEKVQQIEAYYKKCAEDGATADDIEASKPSFTLGLTATPERADDKSILDIFKNTAHKLDIQTAVEIGELVPVRCIRIHTNIDLTKVRFNSVQYNIRDLESKIYVPERNRLIVDTSYE